MILVDSNVPMYLVGAEHPLKGEARRLLEAAIGARRRLVTDAEVLQEILHRYGAIGRREAIAPAFAALLGVVDEVFPVEREDVEDAAEIIRRQTELSARDAVHLAVARRRGVDRILSFDTGFDRVPDLVRVASLDAV